MATGLAFQTSQKKMATANAVSANKDSEDIYPCTVCQNHTNTGIKCGNCHMWTHYTCSSLPDYFLITLTTSTRRYTCRTCTIQGHSNYNDLLASLEESKETERLGQNSNNSTNNNSETTPTATLTPGTPNNGPSNPIPGLPAPGPSVRPKTPGMVRSASTGDLTGPTVPTRYSDVVKLIPAPTREPPKSPTTQPRETRGKPGTSTAFAKNSAPANAGTVNPQTKMKPRACKYYLRNECKYGIVGNGCKESHPKICQKFMRHGLDERSGCTLGWKCVNFHPFVCRRSLHKGVCYRRNCRFPHIKGTDTQRPQGLGNGQQVPLITPPRLQAAPAPHKPTTSSPPPTAPSTPSIGTARDRQMDQAQDRVTGGQTNTTLAPAATSTPDQSAFLERLLERMLALESQSQTIMTRLLAQADG